MTDITLQNAPDAIPSADSSLSIVSSYFHPHCVRINWTTESHSCIATQPLEREGLREVKRFGVSCTGQSRCCADSLRCQWPQLGRLLLLYSMNFVCVQMSSIYKRRSETRRLCGYRRRRGHGGRWLKSASLTWTATTWPKAATTTTTTSSNHAHHPKLLSPLCSICYNAPKESAFIGRI